MALKHDPVIYRETCKALDALFKKHGEPATDQPEHTQENDK